MSDRLPITTTVARASITLSNRQSSLFWPGTAMQILLIQRTRDGKYKVLAFCFKNFRWLELLCEGYEDLAVLLDSEEVAR